MTDMVSFTQCIQRGCGVDVHKSMVVATIDGVGLKRETRQFDTFTSSLTELRDWLLANEVTHVAMESTGVYWKPVFNVLEKASLTVWIVNARHIKSVPGHKTDKKDSAWICKLLLAGLLKPSYIPPKQQRELRDLTRYRNRLVCSIASEKNRIIRILEDGNIKLSCVLSSTSGATATKLIDMICEGKTIGMSEIASVYHKRLQATPEELYEACNGMLTEHHMFMLQTIKRDIVQLEVLIAEVTLRITEFLSGYEDALNLLYKIPGLNKKTVEDLIAEIGVNMEVFPSENHLASWAGMCPGNNESAGKKKSSRTTQGNKHVKRVLVEAAWAATRTKDTFLSAKYHRIAARRGKKRALIAVGHSILKSVYFVLSTGSDYVDLGANYLNKYAEEKRIQYLTKELSKLGIGVIPKELQSLKEVPKAG